MATTLDLAALGITPEELQDRVIQRIADGLLYTSSSDEDGHEFRRDAQFKRKLDEAIQERIDVAVTQLADTHVLPLVAGKIETLTLQKTNEWGEKRGQPISFIEYLTQRADAYMTEQVSYEGKAKGDGDSYNWKGRTTRIAFMIDKHLHYSIENAMKEALANANSAISKGLEGAVKLALEQVKTNLSVKTETRA